MKDILGRDIEVGQKVAYPSRRGSNTYLHVGTVEKIVDRSLRVRVGESLLTVSATAFTNADGTWSYLPSEERPLRVVVIGG